MPLKKMIDADKIGADQLFLRESASPFSLLIVPNRAWTLAYSSQGAPDSGNQHSIPNSPLDRIRPSTHTLAMGRALLGTRRCFAHQKRET